MMRLNLDADAVRGVLFWPLLSLHGNGKATTPQIVLSIEVHHWVTLDRCPRPSPSRSASLSSFGWFSILDVGRISFADEPRRPAPRRRTYNTSWQWERNSTDSPSRWTGIAGCGAIAISRCSPVPGASRLTHHVVSIQLIECIDRGNNLPRVLHRIRVSVSAGRSAAKS